ncbi:MAG: hypothetical protein Kow00114_36410 [Kiloniellaceae bacterium]
MTRTRDEYHALRRRYQPASVSLAIVAESPPKSGKYFYDATGQVSEPLYSALMKILGEAPATKEAGLCAFRDRGWVLVDATYEPVNGLSDPERDAVILRDRPRLVADLKQLAAGQPMPVVLLKANVCALLDAFLTEQGVTVLNRGRPVYFPSNGRQRQFHTQFTDIVGGAGLL